MRTVKGGLAFAIVMVCAVGASSVHAQAAGAGADFNKADRKEVRKLNEIDRLKKVDPPIRPDPVGNALIGGAAQGVARGAAAGAAAVVTGTAQGTAIEKAKEANKK